MRRRRFRSRSRGRRDRWFARVVVVPMHGTFAGGSFAALGVAGFFLGRHGFWGLKKNEVHEGSVGMIPHCRSGCSISRQDGMSSRLLE